MFLLIKMRQLIRNLFLLYLRISWYMGFYKPPQLKMSDIDVYEKKNRMRFIENIDSSISLEKQSLVSFCNENIDPIFYNRKELSKVLETKNNVLEKVWNARIYMNQHQEEI